MTPDPTPPAPPAAPRRRRWPRRILGFTVLLAAGVWFAPTIVARTGLRNRVVAAATADVRGTVTVGGMSAGWLSAVELRDVVVSDRQGRVVVSVPRVVTSKTLLALLRDRSDLGEIELHGPRADVVFENGSTNAEDVLAEYLKASEPAGPRPAVRVRVDDGTVSLRDGSAGPASSLTDVRLTAAVPADRGAPVELALAAGVADSAGKLDVKGEIGAGGRVELKASDLPLPALAPVLRRVEPAASVAGTLSADVRATWADGGKTARVDGTAGVRNLDLAGPWLGTDRLCLAAADLPIKAELVGRSLRVEKAELTCDAGRVSAVGTFDPSEPPERLLDKPGVTVEADIDLAKLAALLPNLLRVREGTAVREGRLVASLVSRADAGGTAWDGSVRTTALKAVRDGKAVEWPEPLSVEFRARAPAGQLPVFDKLLAKSEFIAVNAQGSAENFRAAANVYLDRLAARLGEFVDLGGLSLKGEASAWVIVDRTPAGAFKANAGAELKQFAFAKPGLRPLAEPKVTLTASTEGTWVKDGPVRVNKATVEVLAGTDRLDGTLVDPVPDVRTATEGRAGVRVVGDLGRWADRARRFVDIPAHYEFGGALDATGTFVLAPNAVNAERVSVGIKNAHFRGAGLDIDEPFLNAAGPMTMNRKTGDVVLAPVAINSPTLRAGGARFTFEFPEKAPMVVSGSGPAEGDVNGLARTLRIQKAPDGPDSLHGQAVGPVRFRWQGDATTFGGTLAVTDFVLGPRARPSWRETRLKLDLDAKYEQTADRLTVTTVRVERPGLTAEGKGTWAKFDTTQDVDVAGTLAYDLALLTPELRSAVGGGFEATGKGTRPFSLRGSLNPPGAKGAALAGLTADGGVGWDTVKVYGFEMGRGEFNARLANGVGTVSPVSATFGGGRVSLQPTLKLTPGEVSFAKGRVVEKAKLTPAVCAGAVGYALPVVANAAQAEGEVSFDLDDNRIPLTDFTGAALRGRLLVHRAAVSAGPVVSEIAQLIGESAPRVVLANDMTVPIRVEAGRVHHENLTLTVNGYAVKTNGSAGFDGSLAIVADVPIPGSFPGLKNNPALKKALEGKIVKVPIGGTVSRPVVDRAGFNNAVAAVARDAAKDAAKDVGRDLLNREFERLFPGGAPGAMPGGSNPPPGGRPPLFPLPPGLPVPKK
ncbi:MAG TPA: DUF748 domain-containing protein [Urbifossiella sp.]|nr:DUF748 domain-containing protein [Urbifossiella sp.]